MEDSGLTARLRQTLQLARAEAQSLPDCPDLQLYLLNSDFPQSALSAEEQQAVMERPAYWAFCWPSGQILANYLLRHPELVRGRTVLDFGSGSGVVAVAAARAGAARVWACDLDPDARAASLANARLNGVELETLADFELAAGVDLITAADVFYDPANAVWWNRFLSAAERVLAADCREQHPPAPYRQLLQVDSGPVPAMTSAVSFDGCRFIPTWRRPPTSLRPLAAGGKGLGAGEGLAMNEQPGQHAVLRFGIPAIILVALS